MTKKVFLISGPRDQSKGGIGDYAHTLSNHLNEAGVPAVSLSSETHDVPWVHDNYHEGTPISDIVFHDDYIKQFINRNSEQGETPVLHLQMAIPYCGCVVSPDLCSELSTVLTIHEYKRLSEDAQKLTREYVRSAQHVVFSKHEEYEQIMQDLQEEGHDFTAQVSFQAIPSNIRLPNTFNEQAIPDNWDIVHFGMLRPGKDFDKIYTLAGMLKDAGLNSTINVVGSTLWQASSSGEMGDLLRDMIGETFGEDKLANIDEASLSDPAFLEKKLLQLEEAVPMDQRRLPVSYHLNLSEDDVVERLSQSRLAYMPFSDGASEHSGSLPPVVGWCEGVITKLAPDLSPEGFDDFLIHADKAEAAFEAIRAMIEDPCALKTRFASNARTTYLRERMPESVAQDNKAIYRNLTV